jgi:xanthine dehydrogenase accessory factor
LKESWAAAALSLITDGGCAAIVTVAATSGSTPREAGARMVVGPHTQFGTIGGGNLELVAIDQARKLLARADISLIQQDYALGPLLAQCCGGRVRLLIERVDGDARGWLASANAAEHSGGRYTLVGDISDGVIKRSFRIGWPERQEAGVTLFDTRGGPAAPRSPWSRIVERIAPPAHALLLFGAGHVGRALAPIAQALPFRLAWADTRSDMAGPAGLQIVDDPVPLVRQAGSRAFFLVMTHLHELDYVLVREILLRGDAAFCGVIGSSTKRARFSSRLLKEGVDPSPMVCPIGLPAIRSKAPSSIAVAVAADLLVRLDALATAADGGDVVSSAPSTAAAGHLR